MGISNGIEGYVIPAGLDNLFPVTHNLIDTRVEHRFLHKYWLYSTIIYPFACNWLAMSILERSNLEENHFLRYGTDHTIF